MDFRLPHHITIYLKQCPWFELSLYVLTLARFTGSQLDRTHTITYIDKTIRALSLSPVVLRSPQRQLFQQWHISDSLIINIVCKFMVLIVIDLYWFHQVFVSIVSITSFVSRVKVKVIIHATNNCQEIIGTETLFYSFASFVRIVLW